MENMSTKQLRFLISEYARPSDHKALAIFVADVALYVALLCGVVFLENMALRIGCSILAGMKIASLFVIGHDAAHGAYVSNKLMNEIIARIAFLPALHNYSLWLVEHNRNHHQSNNVKGVNSWSPHSKAEFDAMPAWRQKLERLYRRPAGITVYYLVERWWKYKFFPFASLNAKPKMAAADFLLLTASLTAYVALLVFAGNKLAHTSAFELVFLACVVPFLIWNFMMGFTVYQHHTHETIPWSKTRDGRDELGHQEDLTMHVKYPHWFNLVSHNIMEHTAHHVDPRIPLYNLGKAQDKLCMELAGDMKVVKFSVSDFFTTTSRCKLYDYDNHQWLDFDGQPTSPILVEQEVVLELPAAA